MTETLRRTPRDDLEARVAALEERLEKFEIQAAIRRGRDEAQRGKLIPAAKLIRDLRAKRDLPTP
jgi:hypothetical protein